MLRHSPPPCTLTSAEVESGRCPDLKMEMENPIIMFSRFKDGTISKHLFGDVYLAS